MSSETYRTICRLYRRLNRIKKLVQLESNTLSISMEIFDVFSCRLHDLHNRIDLEYCMPNIGESDRLRLAAMKLALQYDHLESIIPCSGSAKRFSLTIISAEVQKVENTLQSLSSIDSSSMIFLMYFKVLHLLAKINVEPLRNFSVAKHWLHTGERMYMELLSNGDDHTFYDCCELFSKSVTIKPSPTGFDTIDRLFHENSVLLEQINQSENNEIDYLIESFHAQQHTFLWLGKCLAIIPHLLWQCEHKIAAYFLLIAHKLAKNDAKVQSSIATNWMHYFTGIFNRSKEKLLKKCSNDEIDEKSFASIGTSAMEQTTTMTETFTSQRPLNNSFIPHMPHAWGDGPSIPEKTFNCFSSSIPLTAHELRLCVNAIESVDDANDLLKFSMELVMKLICDDDTSHDPMDFIVHNYQMSDLLVISATLAIEPDQRFKFQMQRFQFLQKMIQWLESNCTPVFNALVTTFLSDLNEIMIHLYATNVERMLAGLKINNNEKKKIQYRVQRNLMKLQLSNLSLNKDTK